VRADPLRLGQAFDNLLANAAAAHVLVAAEAVAGAVLVHVCDDGPGIPDDIRASLFQPFVSRGQGVPDWAGHRRQSHGGAWRDCDLGRRPGWTTCFTLRFPA